MCVFSEGEPIHGRWPAGKRWPGSGRGRRGSRRQCSGRGGNGAPVLSQQKAQRASGTPAAAPATALSRNGRDHPNDATACSQAAAFGGKGVGAAPVATPRAPRPMITTARIIKSLDYAKLRQNPGEPGFCKRSRQARPKDPKTRCAPLPSRCVGAVGRILAPLNTLRGARYTPVTWLLRGRCAAAEGSRPEFRPGPGHRPPRGARPDGSPTSCRIADIWRGGGGPWRRQAAKRLCAWWLALLARVKHWARLHSARLRESPPGRSPRPSSPLSAPPEPDLSPAPRPAAPSAAPRRRAGAGSAPPWSSCTLPGRGPRR